ncbi:thiol:disulfide interchange protein DsbA/DsbL [Pseudoluteimonas lycopersici]|nr:thiol:disulfide interchange protein DsbA/DsbL [Lysobacter lycopersici]
MTRILLSLLFSLLLPASAFAAAPAPFVPTEGVDYVVIDGAQPYRPLQGKVEVVEVFAYSCSHCADFQPKLDAWRHRLPRDVRFTFVPSAAVGSEPLSRAYFAVESLGAVEAVHAALFRAIHDDGTMPSNPTDSELQQWLVGQGLPAAKLKAAWDSPAMVAALRHANDFQQAVGIEGTPTLVVDGKYRILGKSRDDQLRILDALIASQRRRHR